MTEINQLIIAGAGHACLGLFPNAMALRASDLDQIPDPLNPFKIVNNHIN
jgi:hypothetical protein